ncbi:LEAF RUST 10 DISEASE-RESISTANCE LOCUS RECEPTOR-LIKE PROTEIN KINASE-like 1.1 isoform X3 [Diospyros lotus]|uniref:LEAF RUST 10 DISEASE-RESISTANCE LOCUS RECEPTOR-LIKE PROTEIN KINASE-like 1.1 isoform X3 n=1 Tax=Diospyros lotus TaxID=55363 RepID=UPI0022518F94|nr:LEAF RUST 10 DISEASE-RESISTANCE LOCUS RECEPTOR-LIKE PROTEIN KINASE-like 1.1 isoform X3 [Diospyros lotus]
MAAVSFIPFVALYFLSHPAVSANDNSKISCPPSFPCRNSGPLLYFPFYNANNPQCGLCSVVCPDRENHVGEITCGNENFLVTEISSTPSGNGSVEVYEPEFTKRSLAGDCSGFRNFSLPNSPSISFTIPHNLTLFKCSKSYRHSPPALDEYLNYTGCDDFNLYYKQHNVSASAHSFHDCETILRPLTSTPSKKKTEPGENDDDLLKLLNGTYHVEFQVTKVCLKCHGRGGQCDTTFDQKFHCKAKKKGPNLKLILPLVTGGVLATCLTIVLIIRRCKRRKYFSSHLLSRNISADASAEIEFSGIFFGVPVFKYAELEQATDHFRPSNELGDGGFGTVYHGILQDGREVAVKRLYEHNSRRVMQFLNEVEILTCLRHPNLVSLYGCTSRHSRELLLVYEYIPNGTLADHIHGDRAKDGLLTWPIRMSIAVETASALAYLHAKDIIHRDVKTDNILLDNNFSVKVADFGLSRLLPTDVTHVSTAPQGTPGYVDPDYYQSYQLTDRSDVYSFGVVLVELISSMPAVDISRHRHEINLANLAINRIQNRAFNELIDPSLGFESNTAVERMTTSVAEVALRCLQLEKEMRPSMNEVLEALKEIQDYKDEENNGELIDNSEPLNHRWPHPSPEGDDAVLLKSGKVPPSPDSVTNAHRWVSGSTTSISSG